MINLFLSTIWLLPFAISVLPLFDQFNIWHLQQDGNRFCYLPRVWSSSFSCLTMALLSLLVFGLLGLFALENIRRRRKKPEEQKILNKKLFNRKPSSKFRKGFPKDKKIDGQERDELMEKSKTSSRQKTSMVVIEASSVSSEAISSSSLLSSSTPFEQSKANLASLVVTIVASLPVLISCSNFDLFRSESGLDYESVKYSYEMNKIGYEIQKQHQILVTSDSAQLATEDAFLPWAWLLAVFVGAFNAVLHLLSDDVISGLGLSCFRSLEYSDCFNYVPTFCLGWKKGSDKFSGDHNKGFMA